MVRCHLHERRPAACLPHSSGLITAEMNTDVHALVQDANDIDGTVFDHAIVDHVAAGELFAISGPNERNVLSWQVLPGDCQTSFPQAEHITVGLLNAPALR